MFDDALSVAVSFWDAAKQKDSEYVLDLFEIDIVFEKDLFVGGI